MASKQIQMPALGRPFKLGMLYDACKDELCTGLTLWDKTTIEANVMKQSQNFSTFEMIASDSIEKKSSLLDIEASLKASFLSGQIEVGGSAKYLNDKKKFKDQSRVTLHYKATTHFEQLSVSDQLVNNIQQQTKVTDRFSATHVVTGIIYGANAFFVFDSEKLDASSIQNTEGQMQAAINKIPSFTLEGKVDIKLSDEEKAVADKVSCKFYGDFILDNNPATFEDAVKTYRQLPKMLGEKGQNAVPFKVWLTPLSYYISTADTVKAEVNLGLLRKAEEALEDMREIEMRCNDALENEIVDKFPEIRQRVSNFRDLCNNYTTKLQRTMMEKFPAIRAGKEDDSSVRNLFDDKKTSPFSHKNLDKWLNNSEREINIIWSYVKKMKGTVVKTVSNQSALEREVLTPGVDHTLCFAFTSLETADPYLQQMADYFGSNESLSDKNVTLRVDQWYYSNETLTKMRKTAEEFCDLAKGLKSSSRFRFLVAVLPDQNQKGAAIYHYKEGSLQPEIFSKPEIHDVKTITDRTDLLWYATDLTLDPDTANGYLTLSEENKKATRESWQTYPDLPERFDECPQVLCKEGLKGIHYWEIVWRSASGGDGLGIGVTYNGIARKGQSSVTGLGYYVNSWCFGKDRGALRAWYKVEVWKNSVPSHGCNRVGVFLNCPAGTLSFYSISSNTLTHIYTFEAKFTEPLYPGLWIYHTNNYAGLSPLD